MGERALQPVSICSRLNGREAYVEALVLLYLHPDVCACGALTTGFIPRCVIMVDISSHEGNVL